MPGDPLHELLTHLTREARVPLEWTLAHSPDGRLAALWLACGSADTMLRLTAAVDPEATVRAVEACWRSARVARPVAAPYFDALREGLSSPDPRARTRVVGHALMGLTLQPFWQVPDVLAKALLVAAFLVPALAIFALGYGGLASLGAGVAAVALVAHALIVLERRVNAWPDRTAGIVRAHAPCPTLAQLIAAHGRR